jgi:hypothetical protein
VSQMEELKGAKEFVSRLFLTANRSDMLPRYKLTFHTWRKLNPSLNQAKPRKSHYPSHVDARCDHVELKSSEHSSARVPPKSGIELTRRKELRVFGVAAIFAPKKDGGVPQAHTLR